MEREIEELLAAGFSCLGIEPSDKGCYLKFMKNDVIVNLLIREKPEVTISSKHGDIKSVFSKERFNANNFEVEN